MDLTYNTKYYLSLIHNNLIKSNKSYNLIYHIIKKHINYKSNKIIKYKYKQEKDLDKLIIDYINIIKQLYNQIDNQYNISILDNNKQYYDYYPWKQYIIDFNKKISFEDFLYKYHTNLDFQGIIDDKYKKSHKQIIKQYNIDDQLKQLLLLINEYYFISLDIKLYCQNNINRVLSIKTDIFNLKIYYEFQLYTEDIIKIYNNINVIIKWISNLTKSNKRYLNIYIILSPIKKYINHNDKILSPYNVNSGVSSTKDDILCVWRYEDIYKVLIHELIHYYDLDIKYDKRLNEILNVKLGQNNYPVLINESITELLALFYHTIFITYHINYYNLLSSFKKLLLYEIMFSWLQLYKISKHYNITSFNDYYKSNQFNQTSNVFSYYILKCFYTFNIFDNITNLILTCSVDQCNYIIQYTNIINNSNFVKYYNDLINSNIDINDQNIKLILYDLN